MLPVAFDYKEPTSRRVVHCEVRDASDIQMLVAFDVKKSKIEKIIKNCLIKARRRKHF